MLKNRYTMLQKGQYVHILQILINKYIILLLLIINLNSIVDTKNTLENEPFELSNHLQDMKSREDILYVKKDETTLGVSEFNNHDVGFDLLVCLRLYKFRTEVTFTDELKDVGSIGARLIGPLYRAAYNGDFECVHTLIKEIQTSDILKGKLKRHITRFLKIIIIHFKE